MDELLIPVKRANGVFGALITTPFVLAGLALIVVGVVFATGSSKDADGGIVFGVLGVLVTLLFGTVLLRSVRSARSPGRIRLTPEAFEVYHHSFAWSDVDDFQHHRVGGDAPTDYVKVAWAPTAAYYPAVKRSARFARFGQSIAPTYLQADLFDTGGPPLLDVLREWLQRSRSGG